MLGASRGHGFAVVVVVVVMVVVVVVVVVVRRLTKTGVLGPMGPRTRPSLSDASP